MRIPRPVVVSMLAFAFPMLTSLAWFFKYATLGDALISAQLSMLVFQIQKYFWSEADYHSARSFFMFRKN